LAEPFWYWRRYNPESKYTKLAPEKFLPPTQIDNPKIPRRRWRIALLLGVGVIVNYFDRINVSVSRDALHAAFGISLVGFGYLSSAYNWTYALMQMPSGMLLDRFGLRRVGRIGTFLWSVASFASAAATGLGTFIAARFLLGVGESPTFPGNAKALGYWFPSSERSLPTAISDASAKFAAAIGVPLLGVLLIRLGWRWSFAATGFISLLYFFLFYWIYRNPSEDNHLTESERQFILQGGAHPEGRSQTQEQVSLRYLLRQRKVWGLALGWGGYNYTFYLLLTWLPSYLSISLHLDLLHSVLYTSVPWLVGSFTDIAIGGWGVDALIARGYDEHRVRQIVLLTGTTLGLGILGAAATHTIAGALFWISLSTGGLSAAAPVAWTIPSLIAPRESVATIAGITNFSSQISALSAPIITGYIVAATHTFASSFVMAGLAIVVGVAGYVFLLGRMEPIPDPQ
jgi:ACS family D-galactonate transporter-like MFS transporter